MRGDKWNGICRAIWGLERKDRDGRGESVCEVEIEAGDGVSDGVAFSRDMKDAKVDVEKEEEVSG